MGDPEKAVLCLGRLDGRRLFFCRRQD
jgi:hypothetical protein